MIRRLTLSQVVKIHEQLVCDAPLTDQPKLEGALGAPFHGWGETQFYPSLAEKATKHLEAVSRAHAFLDGNKRVAWLTTVTFSELNGVAVTKVPDQEAADLVEGLLTREVSLVEATVWFNERLVLRPDLTSPIF